MKIKSSQLSFNSEREYEEKDIFKRDVENLDAQRNNTPTSGSSSNPRSSQNSLLNSKSQSIFVKLTQSKTLQVLKNNKENFKTSFFSNPADVPKASSINNTEPDDMPSDPKLAAMKRMLDAMMGKKLKITNISDFGKENSINRAENSNNISKNSILNNFILSNSDNINLKLSNNLTPDSSNNQNLNVMEMPARKVRITEFNSHYESENTKFNAIGTVQTETGGSINFTLNLNMKREFFSEKTSQIITDADFIDPLVVNFSGSPAELTDVKFKFDLNSDGQEENISWLSSGSGFLVLDRNKDGVINNGSEMFGTRTNNGFQELAELDEDKNGWIDENDSSFEQLAVWSGESPETAALKSLKESSIGAVSLQNTETEFTLKETNQSKDKQSKDQSLPETLGKIRRTGIYLDESGKARTIQQLDLAV